MNNETEREQEWMDRWERRGRFFRGTVIGDFTLPPLGIVGLIVLAAVRVDAWEPYAACLALITAPAGGVAFEALRDALLRRGPPSG